MVTRIVCAAAACLGMFATIKAHAEGSLNIYNWGDYTAPALVSKFEKQYNVKVTIATYDTNDEALAKIRQGGTGFDIVIPSQSFLPIYIKEGLLLETNPGEMSNAGNIESEWRNPTFDPGRKYSAPWLWYTTGIEVNTTVFSGDIDTWGIIFDPPKALQGKINVVPEMNDVMFGAIRYEGGQWCSTDKTLLTGVRNLLVKAKKSWISLDYASMQRIASGDIDATTGWSGALLRYRFMRPGLKYVLPKEGFTYGSDNVVVLKDAKNVDNAKLFQNFMMDPENAALEAVPYGYPAAIKGADKYYPKALATAPEFTMTADQLARATPLYLCDAKTSAIYGRIWSSILK